jgi:membrane fusion protein (multidrug efflux system)
MRTNWSSARRAALAAGPALAFAFGAGCRPASPPVATPASPPVSTAVSVTVAPAAVVPIDRTLPVVGTLFAKDEATVAAEVEGKLGKTMAEFGDRIRTDQPLALVDTESYTALAAQAAARVAQAKAASVSADRDLARQEELRRTGIASPSDYDAAVANADQARAALRAAEAAETVARINVDRSRVRAPFDAAVAERIASAGDYVKPGSPLYRIVNDDVLKFIVQAPEGYAPQVRKELPVVFTVDAHPGRTFEGRVFLVSPQVSAATRMFAFGALVTNADHVLKAGTYARGELVLERGVPTVLVPLESVFASSGVSRVYVVTNDTARVRVVVPGRVRDGRQEILSGIAAGERVATSGLTKLRDGQAVVLRVPAP